MPKLPPQPVQQAEGSSHPALGGGLCDFVFQLLSDPGGLTQFGAVIEILPPGAKSSFRHWHEAEDEMVVMLEGAVVLVEDMDHDLISGSYVSHIVAGGQRIVAPFKSLMTLRLIDNRWRATSDTNGLANSHWPLIRLELAPEVPADLAVELSPKSEGPK